MSFLLSFPIGIAELEKEEEILKKSVNIDDEDKIDDAFEKENYAFQSVLHQLSPR